MTPGQIPQLISMLVPMFISMLVPKLVPKLVLKLVPKLVPMLIPMMIPIMIPILIPIMIPILIYCLSHLDIQRPDEYFQRSNIENGLDHPTTILLPGRNFLNKIASLSQHSDQNGIIFGLHDVFPL